MIKKRETGGPEAFLDAGGVIEDGGVKVMSMATHEASIGYQDGKPISATARFDQGVWWRKKDDSWVRIADMTPGHRYNTAAMLMRNAAHHAFVYSMGFSVMVAAHDGGEMAHDALERMDAEIRRQSFCDPAGWLRSTALYKALTAGLTISGRGEASWQANGHDPVTGEPCEVPEFPDPICQIPACGCSGKAHA